MTIPDIDYFIERLEAARKSGAPLSVEKACREHPEMIEAVRARWAALHPEARHRADDILTRPESSTEVEKKLAAMPDNVIGTRLVMQTELHIEEYHDCGGLGEVYQATDESLSRTLAVKLLRYDRQFPSNLDDFKREAQIIGLLNHPGIVSIVGWGETFDGRPFYAMPFVNRGNLLASSVAYHSAHPNRIDESEKDFRDLIYRLSSVCKTIAYAHSRGIVHRDLKPENVMLGKYGETLVIDWGCATQVSRDERFKIQGEKTLQLKGINDSTSSGGMTLRYASPEQLHGDKPVGPESDIYSLGAILYRLLSGHSPFENVPNDQVRGQSLAGKLEAVEAVKAGVPKPLAAICRKAMAVSPADRYATAMAMSDDLERFLSDASVSVCRTGLGTRMVKFIRRNRTASALLVGVLVVAAGLLSFGFAAQSVLAIKAKTSARERLQLAATMAANLGGFEIDRRFSLLEHEAQTSQLVSAMAAIDRMPNDRGLWDKPQSLVYEFQDLITQSGVAVDSIFINDARGVQIARAPKSNSIGENFAYRNYFHGQPKDLDPQSPEFEAAPPPPAPGLVISNAYVGTSPDPSGEFPIKTALSVAIVDVDSQGVPRIVGRLGMSVRVNDLGIFKGLTNLSADACLVEMRDYPWGSGTARGLILERKIGDHETFSVPAQSVPAQSTNAKSGTPDNRSEIEIKDAMPRLDADSIEALIELPDSRDDVSFISGFMDPQIDTTAQDAACAVVRLPYRDQVSIDWAVLFYEVDHVQ